MTITTFKTTADLVRDTLSLAERLPRPSVVIGVPRSGMIPASILAQHWNVPLTTPETYARWGEALGHGRRPVLEGVSPTGRPARPLIVDDSTNTGASLEAARSTVSRVCSHVDTVAIYGNENCPHRRVFEWNLFYSWAILEAAVDLDGVLCRDPTREENDDGEQYRKFLWDAEPIRDYLEVGYIVTARLERYRAATEAWLGRHRIKYRALYMLNATAEERRAHRLHAKHKADVCAGLGVPLMIESSQRQSREIRGLGGPPVYCTESRELYT